MKKLAIFFGALLLSVVMIYCGGETIKDLSSTIFVGRIGTEGGIVSDSSCAKACERPGSVFESLKYFECYNFCDQQG